MNSNESSKPHAAKIAPELGHKIRAVSFVCAAAVVLLHAYNQSLDGASHPVAAFVETLFSRELCSVAVPMFFMISGFLLARNFIPPIGTWYCGTVKKRVRSLLAPYLLWCTIYALTVLPFTVFGNYLSGRAIIHNTCLTEPLLSVENIFRIYGSDLFGFPADGPLWYVRNLMMLVLISPLLLWVRRRRAGIILCLVLGLLFCFQDWIPDPYWQFFESGFSLRGIFFCAVGMFLGLHPISFAPSGRGVLLMLAVWLGLSAWGTCLLLYARSSAPDFLRLVHRVAIFPGLASIWFAYEQLPVFRGLAYRRRAKYSFFLYAVHFGLMGILFCRRLESAVRSIIGEYSELPLYILRFAVTLTVALLAAHLLNRFSTRMYSRLSGGR
ncbi:MAG: acyltransferase [Victivallaceae bacterium]|nr:acyltransferase [Victivallaceae bacterium]